MGTIKENVFTFCFCFHYNIVRYSKKLLLVSLEPGFLFKKRPFFDFAITVLILFYFYVIMVCHFLIYVIFHKCTRFVLVVCPRYTYVFLLSTDIPNTLC